MKLKALKIKRWLLLLYKRSHVTNVDKRDTKPTSVQKRRTDSAGGAIAVARRVTRQLSAGIRRRMQPTIWPIGMFHLLAMNK